MKRTRSPRKLRLLMCGLGAVLEVTVLLTTVSLRSAQDAHPNTEVSSAVASADHAPTPVASPKPEPKKSTLEVTKDDAAQLSELADKLRDELYKMNMNVFPLDVIHKTEQVEKLARKMKDESVQPQD
jgi:hypothetical protein